MPPNERPSRPAVCPYLGRTGDPDTHFVQASHEHRCHATEPASRIRQQHQTGFCFGDFVACPSFLPLDEAGERARPVAVAGHASDLRDGGAGGDGVPRAAVRPERSRLAEWARSRSFEDWTIAVVSVLIVAAIAYGLLSRARSQDPLAGAATLEPGVARAAADLAATATATATTPATATARPTRADAGLLPPTVVVPTPPEGGLMTALSPSERGVGSWDSVSRLPTFGRRELNVGRFDERTESGYAERQYAAAALFPLQKVPAGSRITYAALELAGLSEAQLAGEGTWTVSMLGPRAAEEWGNLTYDALTQAPSLGPATTWTVPWDELAPRKVNVLEFSNAAIRALTDQFEEGEVAFRIEGPSSDADNLFAWDSGYGEGFGTRPVLRVGFVPPPPTPGPRPGEPTEVPLVIWVAEPTPAPTATPFPGEMPPELSGMILFLSDRFGSTSLMVVDPDSGRIGQVTQTWPYAASKAQRATGSGVSVAVAGRPCGSGATPVVDETTNEVIEPGDPGRECTQLVASGPDGAPPREITQNGFLHYEPAVSPDGAWIAYVSTVTGGDELFKIRRDGSDNTRLTDNDWAWDKHPSWSPDGSRIAFWSNRDGLRQIYVMDADGTNVRRLTSDAWENWDPVWVR